MDIYSNKSLSVLIKEKARELGFDLCGITNSRDLAEHIPVIQTWCDSGMNADMSYLGRNVEKRIDPGLLFSGAKYAEKLCYLSSDLSVVFCQCFFGFNVTRVSKNMCS